MDAEARIQQLEEKVASLKGDVADFIEAVWSEAGAAKATQTAVVVLMAASKANPLVMAALKESLNQAERDITAQARMPASYMDAFHQARAFILAGADGTPGEPPNGSRLQ